MNLATLMRHPTKDLGEGLGIAWRAIGCDAPQRQVTRLQRGFESPQKSAKVIVGGIVVSDVIAEAFVTAMINRRKHTAGTVIAFIGCHIP